MPDLTLLHDAVFVTEDEQEIELLNDLINSIERGSPSARRRFTSGEIGDVLSVHSIRALGKVLRSFEAEEEAKRKEKALAFSHEKLVSKEKVYGGSSSRKRSSIIPLTPRVPLLVLRKIHGPRAKIVDSVEEEERKAASVTADNNEQKWGINESDLDTVCLNESSALAMKKKAGRSELALPFAAVSLPVL